MFELRFSGCWDVGMFGKNAVEMEAPFVTRCRYDGFDKTTWRTEGQNGAGRDYQTWRGRRRVHSEAAERVGWVGAVLRVQAQDRFFRCAGEDLSDREGVAEPDQ